MKIQVGNKTLNIRKWKGKDKKNFIKTLHSENISSSDILDSILFPCVEESTPLSKEEIKYVLSRIRAISLGEDYEVEYQCRECGKTSTINYTLSDTMRPVYKPLKNNTLVSGNHKIKIGNIKNQKFYLDKIEEDAIYDFLLRVESVDGNNAFTLDELVDIIDDLDVDVLDDMLEQFEEHVFRVDDTNNIKCECGYEQVFKFDEIPQFIPDGWIIE